MTHHLLYWLGTNWWSLGLVHAQLLCVSKTCPLRLPWSGGSSAHSVARPWLLMAWATFWFLILYGPLPSGARFYLIMGFSSFSPFFCSFPQSMHFLLHHSAIPTMMLLDPSLLSIFGPAAYFSLNDLVWSLGFLLHCLRAPMSHFLLGILGPFTFLGHPRPFLILCSHGLLLTPLGFFGLITLSFIFWAYGFSINPLLSLLALLWACYGPFSLFYITCYPWVCYFSLSGLF